MSKLNHIQTNFSAGELSPELMGRTDIAKYFNGAEILENMLLKSYGGTYRRPGTYYVSTVKDSSKVTRLIPFQFSTTQAYIIEVGDLYMRFYKDEGQIIHTLSTASAWLTSVTYSVGAFVKEASVIYYCIVGHTSGTFASDLAAGDWVAQDVYEIPTTYTAAELFELQFAQSADTMYIVQKNHAPAKLARTGHTAWTLTTVSFTWLSASPWSAGNGYPACVTFYEQRLCFAGTKAQPQTVWMSVSQDYENMTLGSNASDALEYTLATNQVNAIRWMIAGKLIALGTSGGGFTISSGLVDSPVTPTNVTVKQEVSYGSAQILPKRISNYFYYIQRNNRTLREFSYSFDSDSYIALDMTLLADHITESGIIDMDYQESPDNTLWCVRTDGQIATLTRQIDQQVIGWTRQTTDGKFKAVAIIPHGEEDEVWVIVERSINGSTVQYVEYLKPCRLPTEQEDCYFVDSGLTRNVYKNITAITIVTYGLKLTATSHGYSNGNIITIRNVLGTVELNKCRFLVSDVTTHTFILKDMDGNYLNPSFYSTYISGGKVRKCDDNFTGLTHLIGKTVDILADGAVLPPGVVDGSGEIDLDNEYAEIHSGLHFSSKVKTLRVEGGSSIGSAQGLIKRIYHITIRLFRSLGVKIGTETVHDIIPFRDSSMNMGQPPALFTGDKEMVPPIGYDKEGQIYIEQDQPLPLHIICLVYKVDVSDV